MFQETECCRSIPGLGETTPLNKSNNNSSNNKGRVLTKWQILNNFCHAFGNSNVFRTKGISVMLYYFSFWKNCPFRHSVLRREKVIQHFPGSDLFSGRNLFNIHVQESLYSCVINPLSSEEEFILSWFYFWEEGSPLPSLTSGVFFVGKSML